jgi:hypothetical protein
MIFSKPKDKAFKHEAQGDKHRAKKNFKKAVDSYRKAIEVNDAREALYDKLLTVMEEFSEAWTEEDFALNVYCTMRKQELADPTFKRIHARAEPQAAQVADLVKKMLSAKSQDEETKYVEAIAEYGELAVYPLIDFILLFKEMGKKS